MMLAYERLAEIAAAPPRWLRRRRASASVRPWTAAVGRRETAPDRPRCSRPRPRSCAASAGFTTEAAIPRPVPPSPPPARRGGSSPPMSRRNGGIAIGHQEGVGGDAEDPAVHAEHEVVDRLRVTGGEQQDHGRDQHHQPDQAPEGEEGPLVAAAPHGPAGAGEDRDDEVVRDGQQPPLDERQSSRELLRVFDLEAGRVVRDVLERERGVPVGAEGAVGVEADAPAPAQHADVEVEQAAGIASGEQDREQRDYARREQRDPQEEEDHEVGDRQQPLHQPQPAAQRLIEGSFEPERVAGQRIGSVHGRSFRARFGAVAVPPEARFGSARRPWVLTRILGRTVYSAAPAAERGQNAMSNPDQLDVPPIRALRDDPSPPSVQDRSGPSRTPARCRCCGACSPPTPPCSQSRSRSWR